jgi:hypothetical protein
MKPIFALIPSDDITQKIYQIRSGLIRSGWGVESERTQALPHLSVSYLTEINDNTIIEGLKSDLAKQFLKFEAITLDVVRVRTWSSKVSLMFDNKPVRELVLKLEILLSRYGVSDSQNYLNQLNQSEAEQGEKTFDTFEEVAGDHIKIARNIKDEYLNDAITYISELLPKTFTFNRLVFIDYGCTEKDILWQLTSKLNP